MPTKVRGTGWQPSYRAMLDSAKASVLLERQALVAQNSGEDRSNVQLTPPPASQRATHPGPPAPPLDAGRGPAAATGHPGARHGPWPASLPPHHPPRAMERRQAEEMPSFDVSTMDKAFATEFAVPQRITVLSNGQRITLALGTHQRPPACITRTAPGHGRGRHLVADLASAPGVSAGSVGLYRDAPS